MTIYFLELPGWRFDAAEISAGVYRIAGSRGGGTRVEHTGGDPTELLERCRRDALELARVENSP